MTSCHDFLFPSRQRTVEIILRGEYYKYLDEFSRSLSSFRATWSDKRWSTYPLTEYVRLCVTDRGAISDSGSFSSDASGLRSIICASMSLGSPSKHMCIERR